MPEYQVIKKGRISSKSDVPVKALSYVIADSGTKRFILIRLRNKSKAALNAVTLTVSQYDEDGKLLRAADIEQKSLEEGGKFVLPQKIAAEYACAEIKVEVQRADYGSYRYVRKGSAAVLEYTDTEYKPPVYDPENGKDSVKEKNTAAVRKYTSPILISFLAIVIFVCMVVFMYDHLSYYDDDIDSFRESDVNYEFVVEGNEITGVVATGYSGVTGVVTIPETVGGYQVVGIEEDAFAGNTSITRITIEGDIDLGTGAFRNCSNLLSAYINGMASINEYTFYGCTSLIQVVAYNAEYVGNRAFYNCYSLTTAYLGSNVIVDSHAFYNCESLCDLDAVLVDSVGNSAFYNCYSLAYVNTSNLTTISSYAFYSSGLCEFDFTDVISIGKYAFEYCYNLGYAEFNNPNLIIGGSAFYGSALQVVVVYAVYSIGDMAFYQCYNLTEVYDYYGLGLKSGSTAYGYIAFYANNVYYW